MDDQSSQIMQPNPKSNCTNNNRNYPAKRKKNQKSEFEFCNVCKLNHDQGQRHKYLPNHKKSLAAFLAKIQKKIADIRFFLKSPSVLPPERASHNQFRCVFCDEDIDELGSSYACENAINHLASANHLKNLKHFLWKHGAEMNRVDTFTILVDDVAKWEKKCQSLNNEAVSSGQQSQGVLYGPSNDIHNELRVNNINVFENTSVHPLKANNFNGVSPLLYNTNEYQISHSGTYSGSNLQSAMFSLPTDMSSVCSSNQQSLISSSELCLGWDYHGNQEESQNERSSDGNMTSLGLQSITQVNSLSSDTPGANVHSGAPPPWFEANEEKCLNGKLKPTLGSCGPANKSAKFHKLNPKRVGAAWAEKRKMEMEMEKRGEITDTKCDTNWLPNFGRVWQSGTRKESRKEFENENEKQISLKGETNSETPLIVQPYVSKRMRSDAGKC